MSNPWLKANPFMSMWLTGFNQMTGAMRSQATAAVNKATKDNMKAMTDAVFSSPAQPTKPKPKPRAKAKKPTVKK